ncbi:MAG: BatA domain-containing protein [Armatimonadota bacterium]
MTLATPIWLAAAISIVVPILIHLFGRPRPRLQRFPSLMLLRRAQSERRSTARLRRIVTLILRCLALILLAIVLSGPLSEWPPLARLGEPPGATAIVLDTSPSMAASGDAGRPLDLARAAGLALVKALPANREIIFSEHGGSSRALTPSEAANAIAGASRSDRRARLGDDLSSLLRSHRNISRVFLLTDAQATSLSTLPESIPSRTRPIVVDAGVDVPGNSGLDDLRSDSPVHLRQRRADLLVTARSFGETAGRVPVTVEVEGQELVAGIDLLPDARTRASVEIVPRAAGVLTAVASLPEDAVKADDRRVFATVVRERLRVAVIGEEDRTRFIDAALAPYPAGDPRSPVELVSEDELVGGAAPDAVIVAGAMLGEEAEGLLRDLAEGGTGVMFFAESAQAVTEAPGLHGVTVGEAVRREPPLALAELAITRAPLAEFAEPGAGDLSAARFTSVPDVRISDHASAVVLARYDDGTPALLEGAFGRGRTLLFATSPDDAWSDLVRMPEFVPLMHRLVLHLSAGGAPTILAAPPGEATIADLPDDVGDLHAVGPDGDLLPVEQADGAWRFTARSVGVHRLQSQGEDIAAFAVNLNRAESEPARLSHDEVRRWLRSPRAEVVGVDDLPGLLERLGPGAADLSSLIALLALLIVAVESVQSLRPRGSGEDE